MTGRDWRAMTRHDFDSDAPAPALFELAPGQVPPDDREDTLDMFALLETDPEEVSGPLSITVQTIRDGHTSVRRDEA